MNQNNYDDLGRKMLILGVLILAFAVGKTAFSQTTTSTVTYITTVQEERRSTRFTLTEWLRIKERMKMMDVWLAIFSDPKKKHRQFKPELNLTYQSLRGQFISSASSDDTSQENLRGLNAGMQIWLTNLVSASTGLRMVNIDLGFEASYLSNDYYDEQASTSGSGTQTSSLAMLGGTAENHYIRNEWSANLRLFGEHIQDTSLIGKVGRYTAEDSLFLGDEDDRHNGTFVGGELQIYLTNWLGAEGKYHDYTGLTNTSAYQMKGQFLSYAGFIEISLLRLMFGQYEESWQSSVEDAAELKSKGYLAGGKIQF